MILQQGISLKFFYEGNNVLLFFDSFFWHVVTYNEFSHYFKIETTKAFSRFYFYKRNNFLIQMPFDGFSFFFKQLSRDIKISLKLYIFDVPNPYGFFLHKDKFFVSSKISSFFSKLFFFEKLKKHSNFYFKFFKKKKPYFSLDFFKYGSLKF